MTNKHNIYMNIETVKPLRTMGATSSDLRERANRLIREKKEYRRLADLKQNEINKAEGDYLQLLNEEKQQNEHRKKHSKNN